MTEIIKAFLANPIVACGMIFLVSAISLIAALIAQYAFGLEPCILCIYQRWPYGIAMLLAVAGLGTLYDERWTKYTAIIVFMCAIVFFTGGLIAFYHVGVEQHWWASAVEGCAANFETGSIEQLKAMMDKKPAVPCDQVAWSFLGVSMAGYNLLLSFALAAGCGFSAVYIRRKTDSGL